MPAPAPGPDDADPLGALAEEPDELMVPALAPGPLEEALMPISDRGLALGPVDGPAAGPLGEVLGPAAAAGPAGAAAERGLTDGAAGACAALGSAVAIAVGVFLF